MKTRTLRIVLGLLACLALLAAFSTSGAQAPTSPPPPQYGGEEPEFQEAPLRPGALEPPPPGTGFVPPPMDLSHLTGQRMPEGVKAQALPSTWDWRTQSKVTPVKAQGGCGACYAFAAVGNVEAKMLVDGAGTFDFSENNAKECNYRQASCAGGNFRDVVNLFSQKGTVLELCDPYVPSNVPCKSGCPYQKTLLDWRIISDGVADTAVLKQYIHTYGPVYTAMYAGSASLPGAYGPQGPQDAWGNELSLYDGSYTLYYGGTEDPNHAVLIVGWDDTFTHAGSGTGGWIVKNSWGDSWGDNGFFYIAYGSARIGTSSSFMHTWQDYDTNGGIMYYDEGGQVSAMGCGSTIAWGLVKFIPTSNTNVTRVEFWTMDTTTTVVDVYIYDDFDGTTLSNQLASKENLSFNEAGYHSVQLDSPVAVTSGDDVIAVVKFTNSSYIFPIPVDNSSPIVTGRTYIRCTEISSWSDVGAVHSADVAIRLRTTSTPAPDVGITKQVIGSDFEPGDPITFTLTIANSGSKVAAHATVTDAMPSQVLTRTFASTLDITPTGTISYVWNVEPLDVGDGGVITIYGRIDPSLDRVSTFSNTATISDPEDKTSSNNTSKVTVGESRIYLPLVLRRYPPPPTSGFWQSTTGSTEFYVTTDGAYVDEFATYINVPACGLWNYKVTHTSPEPIANHQFSFSGSFYASGTFNSETTASGTAGLDYYYIEGCGYVGGDLGSWNATWQNDSQPTSIMSAEIVEPESVGSVKTISEFHTATLVK